MSKMSDDMYDKAVSRRNHLHFDDFTELLEGVPQFVFLGVPRVASNVDLAVLDHPHKLF
jgi:hypothetical protein